MLQQSKGDTGIKDKEVECLFMFLHFHVCLCPQVLKPVVSPEVSHGRGNRRLINFSLSGTFPSFSASLYLHTQGSVQSHALTSLDPFPLNRHQCHVSVVSLMFYANIFLMSCNNIGGEHTALVYTSGKYYSLLELHGLQYKYCIYNAHSVMSMLI